jgi:branched-chain amino acid transport system substrate-binding protein
VTQEDTDFSALVTRIRAAGADVVFFPGQIASQGAQLWFQMREQGVTATLMGGDGFNSPDFIANGANEGSFVSNFAPDITGVPEAADVIAGYQAQYGEFGAFGPPTYVATKVILEAIDRAVKAGTLTRAAVLAEVARTNMSSSILGTPVRFDANGDVQGAQFYIFQVQEGQFTLVTRTTELVMPEKPIKIAIMGPYTGPAASIGVEQLNFARLAVALHNQSGGIPIQLIEEDTQLDPAIATTVAQKLVADAEIVAVIGPSGSQEVEASATLFESAGLAHVSPSATRPSLTQQGHRTFFRVIPNDDVQGPTAANFILNTLRAASVFIIDDQSSYSATLADIVEQAIADAGIPVGRDSVTQEDTDFSALVTRIRAAGADVVFFPGQIASQGAQLWSQMREQGVNAVLMGGDGFNSPDFIANGANEGSYVSNFAPDITGIPDAAEVAEAYREEYGEFGAFGPPTYVAARVIIEAIERAAASGPLTRAAVLAEVARTDFGRSILGTPVRFDANGDVQGAQFYIFQVQDGRFVTVTP